VNVQLIETAGQTHVFARKYEAEPRGIFGVVDRAASDIVDSLSLPAAAEGRRGDAPAGGHVRKKPTEDLAAYNDYIQARYDMSKGSAEGFAEAGRHLDSAIARDPGFALAHDAMAEVHWLLGYMGYIPPQKAYSAGIAQALRAIEIDNSRAETHALLGEFHKTLEYNWPEVRREMTLALRLDPTSPLVRWRYAVSDLMPHGRLEEAIAEIETALESDPLSLLMQGWLGVMLVLAHKWDRALDQAHLLLQLSPSTFWGHFIFGVTYREQRMFEKAVSALRAAIEVSGGMPGLIGWLGLTLGMNGSAAEARSLLDRLHGRAAQGYVPPSSFAWIHLGLGETDNAFEWLDRAVDECDQFMMPIKSYSFFDPLRADPRFRALMRKMNLEP
jgi:tetratricopeptide (TPR) repeat protein